LPRKTALERKTKKLISFLISSILHIGGPLSEDLEDNMMMTAYSPDTALPTWPFERKARDVPSAERTVTTMQIASPLLDASTMEG